MLGGIFKFGHSGVEFFFVLSGFIMIWVHQSDFGVPKKVMEFARKRFVRIYPLVWFSTAILLAMYLLMPGAGRASYRTPLVIAESFALVGRNPLSAIDFPSWTLWHENIFYLFCGLIIWRPRIGFAALGLWTLACAVVGVAGIYVETAFYPLAPINVLFAFGAAIAWFLGRYRLPFARGALVAGLAGFGAFGLYCNGHSVDETIQHGVFGVAATLIVAGAVECERTCRLRLSSWAARAGTLSYPLYLTHMFALPVVAKALFAIRVTAVRPPLVGMVVLVGAALVMAQLVHRFVEAPAGRMLRARLAG